MKVHTQCDKTPPVEFLKKWTKKHSSTSVKRSVQLDGGGELGRNNKIVNIPQDAGCTVQLTAPDSSSENGAVERPHRTIANGLQAMLHGAGLPMKFWPYALQHFVLLNNCVPHGDRDLPPLTICTGKRSDLRLLRIFGCRMCALPTHNREAKLEVHTRQGVFLGFQDTFHRAVHYDFDTGRVKTAKHVAFDESKGYH